MSAHDKKPELSDIEVPQALLDAATAAVENLWKRMPLAWFPSQDKGLIAKEAITAALHSLACEPIVLQREVAQEVAHAYSNQYSSRDIFEVLNAFDQFQRIAFLRKPDPVPEEVKALLFPGATNDRGETTTVVNRRIANEAIIAAVEVGRRLEREAR